MIYYRFVGYIEIPLEPEYENYIADTRQGVEVEYIPTCSIPSVECQLEDRSTKQKSYIESRSRPIICPC